MFVQELHNSMVSPPEDGYFKEAIYKENNIIICYSNLHNILPTKLKKMSDQYTVMCGCECFLFSKSTHLYLLSFRVHYLKKLKNQIHNSHNRMPGEMSSHIFETYKKSVILHGHHIYRTEYDIAVAKICAYLLYQHALPH